MSKNERIDRLEDETQRLHVGLASTRLRVEALEYENTRRRPLASPTPEPVASPWQPMETCEDEHEDYRWFAHADGYISRDHTTIRDLDCDPFNHPTSPRIAWCSATDHPSSPPHPDVLGKVEPTDPQPTVVDWQPIETVPTSLVLLYDPDQSPYEATIHNVENFLRQATATHWAPPLPAPPTEPAPEPWLPTLTDAILDDLSRDARDAMANQPVPDLMQNLLDSLTEPAPEPSPDTKAERYTVQYAHDLDESIYKARWRVDDRLEGTIALCITEWEAAKIAAALNSTPDPLLVGLVDAAVAWRGFVNEKGSVHPDRPVDWRAWAVAGAALAAASDAYLAEQEGEG